MKKQLLKLRNGIIVSRIVGNLYDIIDNKGIHTLNRIHLVDGGKGGAWGDDYDVMGPATNMVIKENGECIEVPIEVF